MHEFQFIAQQQFLLSVQARELRSRAENISDGILRKIKTLVDEDFEGSIFRSVLSDQACYDLIQDRLTQLPLPSRQIVPSSFSILDQVLCHLSPELLERVPKTSLSFSRVDSTNIPERLETRITTAVESIYGPDLSVVDGTLETVPAEEEAMDLVDDEAEEEVDGTNRASPSLIIPQFEDDSESGSEDDLPLAKAFSADN